MGDRAEAITWASAHSEVSIFEEHFRAATKPEMIARMLRNLIGLSSPAEAPTRALNYLELVVSMDSEQPVDRWRRAVLRYQTGNKSGAKDDLRWLLDKQPEGVNLERVQELYRSL
jgi:regulator of sirC expression with transglutaminase-like and TPR domain